jgi:hypothetical protein
VEVGIGVPVVKYFYHRKSEINRVVEVFLPQELQLILN